MKKFVFIYFLSLIFFHSTLAQLNLSWQNIIDDGSSGNESSSISVYDTNGYVYTIGTMRPWGFNTSDIVIAKYDTAGNELWRTFFSGPSGKNEKIFDAALDLNGDLILCGEYFNSGNKNDILVMKYSSIGGFMWMDTIDGPTNLYEQGQAVCIDDANNYYFSGYTSAGSVKGILAKYSSGGQQLWTKTYAGTQQAIDLAYYDHRIYMNCMTGPTGSPTHASLMKLDTAGNIQSSVSLNLYYGNSIIDFQFKDDKIYILDSRSYASPLGSQYGIVCADTAMQVIWDKNFNSGYLSDPYRLCVHDTLLYVAHTEYPSQSFLIPSVKLRGISRITGDSLFKSTVVSPAGQRDLGLVQSIDKNGTSSIVITYEMAPGSDRYYLAQFDPGGLQTGGYAFGDVIGYGEHCLINTPVNALVWTATVYDSIANNTNISTWYLSPPASVGYPDREVSNIITGPVPAREVLHVFNLPAGKYRYEILTTPGKILQQGFLPENNQLELNIIPGFYLLLVYSDQQIYTSRFIKM